MTTPARLLDFLDAHGVPDIHTIHPTAYTAREVAAETVAFARQHGHALAVLPGDEAVDPAGCQFIRLAREREIAGAEPQFGNGTLFELQVYVDADPAAEDQIALSAGVHDDVVRLVKPVLLHLSRLATS